MHAYSMMKRVWLMGLPRGETVENTMVCLKIMRRISLGSTTVRGGLGVTMVMVFEEDIMLVADVCGGDVKAWCASRLLMKSESSGKEKGGYDLKSGDFQAEGTERDRGESVYIHRGKASSVSRRNDNAAAEE
jgi:hypothetical protein